MNRMRRSYLYVPGIDTKRMAKDDMHRLPR
jgi:hypothetical protein